MLFVFVVELEEFFIHSGYKSLIKVGLANIFSRPVHYIRIMYSDTEKFLIFIKSDLSTFSSAGPALGVISKDPCQIRGPEDLTRCFLQACYTFVFILNPLEHFELTFVYGMRLGSHFFFFFLHLKIELFWHRSLQRLFRSPLSGCGALSKASGQRTMSSHVGPPSFSPA